MRWIAAAILAVVPAIAWAQAPQPGVEARLGRGSQLMKQELFEAAASEFEQALALDPSQSCIASAERPVTFLCHNRQLSPTQGRSIQKHPDL